MAAVIKLTPISSDEFTRRRNDAWDSVKDECDRLKEPESGTNMKWPSSGVSKPYPFLSG